MDKLECWKCGNSVPRAILLEEWNRLRRPQIFLMRCPCVLRSELPREVCGAHIRVSVVADPHFAVEQPLSMSL